MSFTDNNGRLGNQFIRNIAVSLIAQKFNLCVSYYNQNLFSKLGIELFSGTRKYNLSLRLTDENYFDVYRADKLEANIISPGYYQTKEITNEIYKYLQSESIKSSIIQANPFKERYSKNNDLFIHVRLGDVIHFNPGLNYYLETIKNISFEHIYISSDSPEHPIVLGIRKLYPDSIVYLEDEVTTLQFASTNKHILLSHGSFSAMIGYISFNSSIYYPEYDLERMWYGDMFTIPGWNKIIR